MQNQQRVLRAWHWMVNGEVATDKSTAIQLQNNDQTYIKKAVFVCQGLGISQGTFLSALFRIKISETTLKILLLQVKMSAFSS